MELPSDSAKLMAHLDRSIARIQSSATALHNNVRDALSSIRRDNNIADDTYRVVLPNAGREAVIEMIGNSERLVEEYHKQVSSELERLLLKDHVKLVETLAIILDVELDTKLTSRKNEILTQ